MYQTTEEDFELFKTECQFWLDLWGMSEFIIQFSHGSAMLQPESDACCGTNEIDVTLTFCLAKEIDDSEVEFTQYYIIELAFHEIGEGLLSGLSNLAHEREITHNAIIRAQHVIINKMQNALLKRLRQSITSEK